MQAKTVAEAHDVENSKAKALADELKAQVEEAAEKAAAEEAKRAQENAENEVRMAELQASEKTSVKEAVTRLLQLTYFSKVGLFVHLVLVLHLLCFSCKAALLCLHLGPSQKSSKRNGLLLALLVFVLQVYRLRMAVILKGR